ncbi:Transcription elongation regulator 1-like protein [Saguinus oedipus]|uniref:Transcription elongation regulator 1-like protein n=1 Tax=Saguinus oedipus TaxID=9490 RepID=A0ABQ9UQ72_SAGOE|nr:Transcription elongation regulator 1-like protein [Saguinus oedipus]
MYEVASHRDCEVWSFLLNDDSSAGSTVDQGGCHSSLKPTSSPAIAIATAAAAAAMVSVDPESFQGPSPSSVQPRHFLTLAPIKIPLRT